MFFEVYVFHSDKTLQGKLYNEINESVVSYNFETGQNELVEVEDKIIVERGGDYKVNNLILTKDHPIYLETKRKASVKPHLTLTNYEQEVDELMKELDTDGTNLLEFPEFLELMQHHSKYILVYLIGGPHSMEN